MDRDEPAGKDESIALDESAAKDESIALDESAAKDELRAIDETVMMNESEVHAFLDRAGTGVLSLAAANVPYATPVSYGFDPAARSVYFRLGFSDGSEKRRFVDASDTARFVRYDRVDDGWKSVIATGTLERIPDDELTGELASAIRRADVPLFDIWDASLDEIAFELYRLRIDRVTGRKTVDSAHQS